MAGVSNYEPYASNAEGLTQALIDLKDTMAGKTVYAVAGFGALAFENVTQGAALYSRSSDGKVGLARAAGTLDEATVVGFVSGQVIHLDITNHFVELEARPAKNTFGVVGGQAVDLVTGLQDSALFSSVRCH